VDKAITTVLLIIAGITCTVLVINAVYPAINRSTASMVSIAGKANDRVQSQIEIIQTVNEGNDVYIWVKNIGASRVVAIEQSDIFFGEVGNFERIPYGEGSPHWSYEIENDSDWMPMATLKITIHLSSTPSGNYFVKVVIPNGISDEHTFSI
jgi:hypothetical protein